MNIKSTQDIWFAGFLLGLGFEIVKVKDGPRRRFSFEFDIRDSDYSQLKLEYVKSKDSKIKYLHEQLKDLAHN